MMCHVMSLMVVQKLRNLLNSSLCCKVQLFRDRKLARYERLALDIEEKGYSVANMPLEIGCRGVIDKRSALVLETICNLVGIKALQKLKGALSRIALLGSYRIFLARRSPEWSGGELISVS